MKFPAIALDTYNRLKSNPIFLAITEYVVRSLRSEKSAIGRARFVHSLINDYNTELHVNPLMAQLSPCKRGCAGCCHTEVSVTPDEAELLTERVNNGLNVDLQRLHIQKTALENGKGFYSVPYELRACIFLGDDNQCRVYEDRPSVCRTNMVIGEAEQCSTRDGTMKSMRLVKTEKSDMAIMGFFMLNPKENSLLPDLLWRNLNKKSPKLTKSKTISNKNISKDQDI